MIERPTVRDVLASLMESGSTRTSSEAEREAEFRDALSGPEEAESPWYVRILIGFAAWVSAFLLALALGLSGIAKDTAGMFVPGLLAFVGGLILKVGRRGDFSDQLALALSLGGRMSMYVSAVDHGHGGVPWLLVIAVEALTVAVYDDGPGRFLATLGCAIGLGGLVFALDKPELGIELAILVIAAGVTAVWMREPAILASRWRNLQRPVGFGLASALFLARLVDLQRNYHGWREPAPHLHAFSISGAGVIALLLFVERDVLRELAKRPAHGGGPSYRGARQGLTAARNATSKVAAGAVYGTTILFGALAQLAPGLASAALVMALAVHRRDRLLFGLAAVFLVFFGSHFYYSLEATFLVKSAALVGSGLLLLAARLLLPGRSNEVSAVSAAVKEVA